jgi:lactoylglutathione lyase
MRHGDTVIGLFEGMFEQNMLTFNPGWDAQAEQLESYTDVREIQRHLKSQGLTLLNEADETARGPGSLILLDPDGNPILFDQHV